MYRYDEFDRQFVLQRTAQFADQVQRRLSGELSEDEFKPLRLKTRALRRTERQPWVMRSSE